MKKLLQELTEHTILLWWDDRDQEIRFDVLRPSAFVAIPEFNDAQHILADSFTSERISKERISRVLTYYGQRDPTEDLEKKGNFQQLEERADLDAETPEEYGSGRERIIFSRWMPVALQAVADEIGQRLLVEYRNTKIVAGFIVDAKDDTQWTGDFVSVITRYIQNNEGQPELRQYRIIEVNELLTSAGSRYKFRAIQTQLNGRPGVWAPDGTPQYPLANDAERLRVHWADEDGNMSNGDKGYVWA